MKYTKAYNKIITLLILSLQISCTCTYANTFEEDNLEDELINIEEKQTDEVDLNNISFEKLRVSARNAIAIDGSTKQILFEQNPYEVVAMASTTKILTALVAINSSDLEKEITISKKAAGIRGSTVGYRAGETIKLKELLFGLMFRSGNDAAIAIAEGLGGSVENFAEIMNNYARGLGLTCSHFETPHGLDSSKHYSSAYDLAILTSTAMENDFFKEICGEKSIGKDKYNFTRDYQNINKILWKLPNANGVKTGYTGQAGKCLVSSIKHENRNIIIVVLNCSDRWNQTEKIFKYVESIYAFRNELNKDIVNSSGISNLGSVIEDEQFDYGFKEQLTLEVEVFNQIDNINKGDILGKISLRNNGEEKLKKSLTSNKKISKENFDKFILLNEKDANIS